jgi:hypothetical protein
MHHHGYGTKRHNPYAAHFQSDAGNYEPVAQEYGRQEGNAARHGGAPNHIVTPEELAAHLGTLVNLARTAAGSSFIQSALREGSPYAAENTVVIAGELLPQASSLMLDAHGCYVIKSVMQRLPPNDLRGFVKTIAHDHHLLYSMCIHSLHTRRVVQFLLESVDALLVADVLVARCLEISMTQQGCIIMQRAMDVTPEPHRSQLFSIIFDHMVDFAVDPFANYVVQHMLEIGDKELVSSAVVRSFRGHVVRLSCNKFASNVMEKCLFHVHAEAQHELIAEMYDADEDVLYNMLQDSFGNYMIQSSIALATLKDVFFINERLRHVLQRTPYGHKIELRIERRLKGRPVGTRSPQIGASSKSSRKGGSSLSSREGSQELTEEPW